jgi:hypothetical protein
MDHMKILCLKEKIASRAGGSRFGADPHMISAMLGFFPPET